MYAPHNNPELQERREDCGRDHERRGRREHGPRGGRGFEGRSEGRGFGRRGHGRPEFAEAAATLRPEMGLLRGAAIAVAAGGTPEQVAKAEAILAEARRALFELLAEKPAEKPAEAEPVETPTETSTDATVK